MDSDTTGENDPKAVLKSALIKIKDLKAKLKGSDSRAIEPVAIIGMGCRFPAGGNGPEAFFQALTAGTDGVRRIPPERWPAGEIVADRPELRWAGLLAAVDGFDAGFFGISPREAVCMDPQQRLLLEVVHESLDRAGLPVDRLMGSRTGVFIGMCSADYQHIVREHGRFDAYSATGSMFSTAAGRISYVLGLQGPCMTVDTACSSSLVAVHLAVQSLRSGESDLALAGGVNILLDPRTMTMLAETQALSPDGRCKAFDARANGFVRGEGCGVVVLKRLSDAERDGDTILALIRGGAVNQDGRSTGMTAPNVLSQQAMLEHALQSARVSAADIGYVETHGTGTSLGDPIELEALRAVLGAPRSDGSRCVLGAVKTNVGHLEAAAGMAGLIKVVLCLERGTIPKNLHFQRLNPRISLDGTPFMIPTDTVPWESHGKPRRAGVSSFGLSGTNAHVILEEAPRPASMGAPPKEGSSCLVTLSARSPEALAALAGAHRDQLPKVDARLHDIAYTASARHSHHAVRLAVIGASKDEIAAALDAHLRGEAPPGIVQGSVQARAPRIVFVFSGQGSQWAGMGQRLLEEEPVFREALAACDAALSPHTGFSVIDELRRPEETSRLAETLVAQPALFAMEVSLAALLCSWGVTPDAVIGHSVAEIVAAHVAGILDLAQAARLVAARARIMQKATGHGELISDLVEALGAVALGPGRIPMISTVTGDRVLGEALGAPYWGDNIRQTVRFAQATTCAARQGRSLFVEVGPHPVLTLNIEQTLSELGVEGRAVPTLRRRLDERAQMLLALGSLYVDGCPVEWKRLYPEGGRVVALPTYPWQRRHFWIESGARAVETAPPVDATADGPGAWLYEVEWVPAARAAPGSEAPRGPGVWVVLADQGRVGAALAARWRGRGDRCIVLERSHRDAEVARDHIQVDATRAGAVEQAIEAALREAGPACRGAVHLFGLDAPNIQDATAEGVASAFEEECASAIQLLRAGGPGRVWLVTRGAQSVEGGEAAPGALQAPLWGLGRTARVERGSRYGGLIDLDPRATAADAAAQLGDEIAAADREDQIALRGGRRYAARLRPLRDRAAAPPLRLRADGTYLVTGGLGGIGLIMARWLVDRGARRLVLLGRTALPPRSAWRELGAGSREAELTAAIRALEHLGVSVHLEAVDVGDEGALAAFLGRFADEGWPPVRGVVHAAGVAQLAPIVDIDRAGLSEVARPKVLGAWLVHRLLRDAEVDFWLYCSSASAILPSPRLAAYAAANAFLDSLAHGIRAAGCTALSIDWGPWEGVGMAARMAADQGSSLASAVLRPIRPDDALAAQELLLGAGVAQAAVLPRDARDPDRLARGAFDAPFFEALRGAPRGGGGARLAREALLAAPAAERARMLSGYLASTVARVLSIAGGELSTDQPLRALGLDSILGMELQMNIERDLGMEVALAALLEGPTIEELTADLLPRLSDGGATPVGAPGAAGEADAPLSFAQEGLWFLHKLAPKSTSYNVAAAFRVTALDVGALRASFQHLVERHASLRTTFTSIAGVPRQRTHALAELPFREEDAATPAKPIRARLDEEVERPFDLERGPLARMVVYRLGPEEHALLLVMHHIITDLWSLVVLVSELGTIYTARRAGAAPALEPLPLDYTDFVRWQRERIEGAEGARLLSYWRRQLDGAPPVLQLPTDRPRRPVQTFAGESRRFLIERPVSEQLKDLCQRRGVMLSMALLAVFQAQLALLTGQRDVVVATLSAGRTRAGLEKVVGYFINTLPIRARVTPEQPFVDLLAQVRDAVLGGLEHQDYPYPRLIERLQIRREPGRAPLCQAIFVLQKAHLQSEALNPFVLQEEGAEADLGGWRVESIPLADRGSRWDLSLIMAEVREGLRAKLAYNSDLFDAPTIDRWAMHVKRIVEVVAVRPETRIADLPAPTR